ncbi:MAG: glycogen synthase GlgA [Leptospiraceae bacterium]|nr:glycogen synthase GlgA [Leptospiraceae bacterium]MDW8305505.1 glycogen synthase GlgA [Leptospiraceae bacterium]
MRVMYVAAEAVPYAKTGGLGDVAGSLPRALAEEGLEIILVMPRYYVVDRARYGLKALPLVLSVPMGSLGVLSCGVYEGTLPKSEVKVYFIEHEHFYGRESLYLNEWGQGYLDNDVRYVFLSRAALELCKAIGFVPDVVHANDWHTGAIPLFLNTHYYHDPHFQNTASVFTIHNMQYQGNFYPGLIEILGVGWHHFHMHDLMHEEQVNLLKAGLVHAHALNTVSRGYAREIMLPHYGYGLDGVLRERFRDFFGILNGIDHEEWNPERDPYLPATFSAQDLSGKAVCKRFLQKKMNLPQRDVPLIGVIARLVDQKGVDVIAEALFRLLDFDIQMVLLGTGESWAETFFTQVSLSRPHRFQARIGYSEELAHQIEAGCDFFLMPSRFEPCGLNQLYSLRYGTLPIVRGTGGLKDTVENCQEEKGTGTGFVFYDLTADALINTVAWALRIYREKPELYQAMQKRAMQQDYSWRRSAKKYIKLYRYALRKKGVKLSRQGRK